MPVMSRSMMPISPACTPVRMVACSLVARRVGIAIIASPLPDHVANYPEVVFRPLEPASHITIGVLVPKSGERARGSAEFIECVRQSSQRLMR